MKKLGILILCAISFKNYAQTGVGIGTTTPNTNAMLDVDATNKGLLIPRVNLVTLTSNSLAAFGISATPVTSLLVYNTTASVLPSTIFQTGFYFWDGANWVKLNTGATSSATTGWTLTGNSGTTASSFIGTTDDNDIFFKRNNAHAGRINSLAGNTSFGLNALHLAGTGAANTAFGAYNLQANTSGYGNTSVGTYALAGNTSGFFNSALGNNALITNTSGNFNAALGVDALASNTTGNSNTANGFKSLQKNTTGKENTAVGDFALYQNTIGNGNVAVGSSANENNTTGFSNVAIGQYALVSNTTGSNLVAIGDSALYNNNQSVSFPGFLPGSENVAIGSKALYANTAGRNNTALGYNALMIADANDNLAIGHKAMSNGLGGNNTAVGNSALQYNNGIFNTAIGAEVLGLNTNGGYNTSLGDRGLYNNTIGSRNTAIGVGSLLTNTRGNYNTAIGANANVRDTNFVNATAIGALARVDCSNCLVLGSKNTINGATSDVNVGIGTTEPQKKLHIVSNGEAMRIEGTNPWIGFAEPASNYNGYLYQTATNFILGTISSSTKNIQLSPKGIPALTVISSGNIGIGTTNPNQKFTIYQPIGIGLSQEGGSGGTGPQIGFYTNANGAFLQTHNDYDMWFATNNGSANMVLQKTTGNVGIGTINPGEKLSVNGRIRSKEVLVQSTGWPDFVFDEKYELPTLKDVEKFITTNKHLPNIPPAIDIETNGQNLGDIQKSLLQKVEELTLYIIEQNKRIEKLEAERLATIKK